MDQLKRELCWCAWKYVQNGDRGSAVPYRDAENEGHSNAPETWLSFEAANELARSNPDVFSGVGFFVSNNSESSLCAITLHLYLFEGDMIPEAGTVLSRFNGTYEEESLGIYRIFSYVDRDRLTAHVNGELLEKYYMNYHDIGMEICIGGVNEGFFPWSGNVLPESCGEVTDQTENVLWFLDEYMKKPESSNGTQNTQHAIDVEERIALARRSEGGARFQDLFDFAILSSWDDKEEADRELVRHLRYWIGPYPELIDQAYRDSAIMTDEWCSQRRDGTIYGQEIIRECLETYRDEPYYVPPLSSVDEGELTSEETENSDSQSESDTTIYDTLITPETVLNLIKEVQNDEENKDRVSVLPLMCGTGKSSALRLKMREIIEADDGNGMIIVTDSIERMHEYLEKGRPELVQFFADHRDQITVMTHDTIMDDMRHQAETPILIMATQRFINLLPSQLSKFLRWNKGTRPLVVVDERPYFYRQIDISFETLSQMYGALFGRLPQRGSAAEERREILEFWDSAQRYLHYTLMTYENKCQQKGQYYFYVTTGWQEADRFQHVFELMEKYRNFINRKDRGQFNDVYSIAIGTYHLLKYGALLSIRVEPTSRREEMSTDTFEPIVEQERVVLRESFSVLINNYEKYEGLDAKVIVLDGTADLSPEYEIYDNIDMRAEQCAQYKRSLSRLHIDIIPKSTGKTVLERNSSLQTAIVEDVHSILEAKVPEGTEPVVFSYKFMKDKFNRYYDNEHYDWFGNIKGKNDYRNAEHIAQVGLHRFPASSYFLLELAKKKELAESLPPMAINLEGSYEEHSSVITEHISDPEGYTLDATYREILADMEQNLFRGIIRNSDNEKDYRFYLFAPTNYNRQFIEKFKQRYEALGAHVIVHERTDYEILKSLMERRNANGPTRVQRLVYWHDKEIALGREYRYADISEAIEANSYQVRQIRKDNPVIDRLFNSEVLRKEWKNVIFIKKSNWYFCDEENEEYES